MPLPLCERWWSDHRRRARDLRGRKTWSGFASICAAQSEVESPSRLAGKYPATEEEEEAEEDAPWNLRDLRQMSSQSRRMKRKSLKATKSQMTRLLCRARFRADECPLGQRLIQVAASTSRRCASAGLQTDKWETGFRNWDSHERNSLLFDRTHFNYYFP